MIRHPISSPYAVIRSLYFSSSGRTIVTVDEFVKTCEFKKAAVKLKREGKLVDLLAPKHSSLSFLKSKNGKYIT